MAKKRLVVKNKDLPIISKKAGVVQRNDFIELKYTGYSNGEVFDSNIEEDLKKLDKKAEVKEAIIVVGQGMVLAGLDRALEGKEIGKEYKIKIGYREGFGERRKELIRTIPLKAFSEKKVEPKAGMILALDNYIVKILAVSGARVIADFNNPLAGKDLEYKFKVIGKVDDENRKARTLFGAIFRFVPEFEVRDKVIVKGPKELEGVVKIFSDRFKNLMGKGLGFEEKKVDLGKMKNKSDKGIQ